MIPQDAIRLRSYFIWQREGCPRGREMEHWLRAVAELAAEYGSPIGEPCENSYIVMPRLPISRRPERTISRRVEVDARAA